MSRPYLIAKDEWRYWWRSWLAIPVLLIGLALTAGAAILTAVRMSEAAHERASLQVQAQEAFLDQPDRHPHRMVHYGHYAFRTPPPLGLVDPGVDAYTGTSVFLEGHRRNSAMFADRQSGASLARFGSLTPAGLMQVLAPLLLILMGYNLIAREREGRTLEQLLSQGISSSDVLLGKSLALVSASALILSPLAIGAFIAVMGGETVRTGMIFIAGYALYLLIWCLLVVFVSTLMRTGSSSLGVLLVLWVFAVLLVPPVSTSTATAIIHAPGKIETDMAIIDAMKYAGDGHNAGDPAFDALRANLLAQYEVDHIEDLPINFRGIVAQAAEAELADIVNEHAEEQMNAELEQARLSRLFGWLSPVLSIREFSTRLAGVDIESHHRFLREAERLRFDFVQGLNRAHAEQLSYADDINRSRDPDAERRTRISSENWKLLKEFQFEPAPAEQRVQSSLLPLMKLLVWLIAVFVLCGTVGRRAL